MGARAWPSIQTENQIWGEVENRQMRSQALSASVTRGQAVNAVALADAFPWLDSGVVQSLTRAGQGPDSPTAQLIAEQAAVVDLEDDAFSEPAPNVPDNQFDGLWDMISTNVGRGMLNMSRFTIAAMATPFEIGLEQIPSAFFAAEQETEPLFDPSGIDVPWIPNVIEPPQVWGSLSRTLRGEFWDNFWTNLTEKAAPSTGQMLIEDIINGRDPKLLGFDKEKGEGLLANFQRRQEYRNRIKIPGVTPSAEDPWAEAATVGRIVAREVTEPGSEPYKLLSGLTDFWLNAKVPVGLAPKGTVQGLRLAAGVANRSQIIAAGGRAGLLPGVKKSVNLDDAVNGFLNKPVAQKMNKWFADESDFLKIWERVGKNTRVARELVEASTPEQVANILRRHLGVSPGLREVPTAGPVGQRAGLVVGGSFGEVFGPGAAIKRSLSNVRFTHEKPVRALNPHNLDDAAQTVHDYVRNAKLGDDTASKYLRRIGDLEDGDASELYRVATDLYEETFESLVNRGSTPLSRPLRKGEARKVTRAWPGSELDETRAFFIDAAGQNADLVPARNIIDGKVHDLKPVAHLMSERLSNSIPLPDVQGIKRAASFYNRVWDIPGVTGSVALADFMLGTAWKSAQLITRLAYPLRVIGEEQVRLAGVGMSSAFRHPVDYLSWVVGSHGSGPVSRALKKGLGEQGSRTALDDVFSEIDEFQSAMSRGSGGWAGMPGHTYTGKFVRVRKGHENYYDGAATEIGQLASDPVAQRVAGGLRKGDARSIGLDPDDANASTVDSVKEWFWSGTGQKFRKELSEDPNWQHLRTGNADMTARQAADDYIDSVMERVNIKTGQHPELVEAVSSGKLRDVSIRGGASFRQEKKFRRTLEEFEDVLPEKVKVADTVMDSGRASQAAATANRAVERMFNSLMSVPTNTLSRSPHFRQSYWGRMEELLGWADRPTQEAILKSARNAGLSRDRLRGMAKIVNKTEGSRLTKLEDVDVIARAHALETTRDTLYDLTRRNQFFDSFRLVFPFGEAWKEIFTAWSKILTNKPSMLRRFQQGIQGGLGPGFGELTSDYLGTGSLPGQGFFHENQHGEMVFNYPGSELASQYLLGEGHPLNPFRGVGEDQDARVAFTGSLSGLNLFSATVLPGVGPTVQLPAAALTEIMNVEIPEALRDTIFPFGTPPVEEGPGTAIFDTYAPAWMGKWATAAQDPDNHRLLGNAWMDVARALVRSGEYNTNSPEAVDELYDAATERARLLFFLRGAAQSTFPSGPTVEWSTEDVQGNLVPTQWMVGEFHRMAQEEYQGDYEKAQQEFLRRFGTENLMALQGKTRELVPRPLNEEGAAWIDDHPELERKYPLSVGLIAPDPVGGEFDYNAYLETIREGTRQSLTPREMVALSNQYKGRIAYEHLKSQVEGRTDAQAALWLADAKQRLAEQYPGFDGYIPLKDRPKVEDHIAELEQLVNDPEVQDLPTVQGMRLYMEARDAAQRVVDENSGKLNGSKGFTRSQSTAFLRDWLRATAEEITNEYPEFAPVWQHVFSRELVED